MIYLYKNEFDDIYEADIGSIVKIVDSKSKFNNRLMYMDGATDIGCCYKDYNNFKNNPDEVCYIAEYCFQDTLFVDYVNENKENLIQEGGISTANSIKEEIRNHLEYNEYYYEYEKAGVIHTIEAKDFDEELITKFAKLVFDEVAWETTQTYISETNWNEDIMNYYNKKLKEKELEL